MAAILSSLHASFDGLYLKSLELPQSRQPNVDTFGRLFDGGFPWLSQYLTYA